MLFRKNQSKTPPLKEYSFPVSNGFRGFKRFPMVVHGYELSEKNNKLLKDADFRGHSVIFRPGKSETYKELFYQVLMDNLQIGAIFDKDQITSINTGRIDSVYARSEEETIIGAESTEKRHRIKLFVHYRG